MEQQARGIDLRSENIKCMAIRICKYFMRCLQKEKMDFSFRRYLFQTLSPWFYSERASEWIQGKQNMGYYILFCGCTTGITKRNFKLCDVKNNNHNFKKGRHSEHHWTVVFTQKGGSSEWIKWTTWIWFCNLPSVQGFIFGNKRKFLWLKRIFSD